MLVTVTGYFEQYLYVGDTEVMFDSSDFLCAQSAGDKKTIILLKHNVVGKNGEQEPLRIMCWDSLEKLTEKMKGEK